MHYSKERKYKSTCSYCGTGCGIVVKKDKFNAITVEGDEAHPVNKGMLCSKGRTLHYTVSDQSDRILKPQMKWHRSQERTEVSWDTAIERAAAVFKSLIKRYGPDSVGFYVSGQLLTEEYYLANKLTKGFLGTNNIDTNSRLCMSSAVVGYKKALGEDAVPISYTDIELADTFFITGANPAWCHPILFRRLEEHKEKNPHVKIIVADPRKTQSCSIADIHLQLNPGTDSVLYKAIGRLIIENNDIDTGFITNHTNGFEAYKESVFNTSIEEAAKTCGIPTSQIYETAEAIGKSNAYISMWAMGLNQSTQGVNKNLYLLNLSLITGQIGKPGAGPFSLTGQPNAMGGREVGGLSNMLAAHRDYTNPIHREEVAKYWGVDKLSEAPGLTATQMMKALSSGKMKAIWIVCTNPLVSWPNARLADAALKKAKFVIVQDISNRSDTLKYADLVLPAAGYLEKEGTMTNSERRISYLNKVLDPPGQALPDTEIFIRFAKKMGFGEAFDYKTTEDIYLEHSGLTKNTNLDISGLNYSILKEKGSVQWPFPKGATHGTQRLFTDQKFFTPNKKAQILSPETAQEVETTTNNYPFILITGRIRDQWHTMTRTAKVKKLNQHISRPFLEIHPEDASQINIQDQDIVEIANDRGKVRVTAKITTDIKKGVVFLPMHWGRSLGKDLTRTNNLTSTLVDKTSKQPAFKFSAVTVKKYRKKQQKIIVIGAGAAAFRFVTQYRKSNQQDEIEVFSREKVAFYNRVMLPEYINGKKDWNMLLKHKVEREEEELDCRIHTETSIEHIDRKNKVVVDSLGKEHTYDLIIMATGSRAFRPSQIPENMKGIFTLRSRKDADFIKKFAKKKGNAVIVGGGLLGIELADSLQSLGVTVTIIQRASRLMERQLDDLGSELLDLELKDRNIQILYTDEVQGFKGNEKLEGIHLKSGRFIPCDTLVFAIGTKPNIEIAQQTGLVCGRGVMVNDFMQTSDKSIYALGEIAEHHKMLYGITAAAEEQAEYAVRYILGDTSNTYKGSLLMNILKVEGLELCSIGAIEAPIDDDNYEEIIFVDKKNRKYKKCLVYQDKLIGAILIGDKSDFTEFRDLIENKIELGEKRMELLQGNTKKREIKGELICSCNSVGHLNVLDEIQKGCTDFNVLCKTTGAGLGCGSCKPEVKAMLENEKILS
ncbi:nitrate reductase [Xanthovirga aplysinae]|uniref:nitrate reductase n=1 Tax=Xanthovirga aplysinae TaxID=2529853 RepID=UPI0012BC1003|nr:nitrate reductase [Xanthovirga aplysinae]MTI32444.1 NAD(P)H-nitrite reductase [Xanthovirga aplysinae]